MVRNTSFSPPYPQKSARHSSAHTYPPLSRRKILCTKGHTSPKNTVYKRTHLSRGFSRKNIYFLLDTVFSE